MKTITVAFELPAAIETALTTGAMERVGGVVRYTDSKQIVAWLLEGGKLSGELASNSKLVSSLLGASGMRAAAIASIASSAVPLLNFAIAGYSVLMLRAEIEKLKREISQIYDRIDKQFERDREVNIRAALKTAASLLDVHRHEYRKQMVGNVAHALNASVDHLVRDTDELLAGEAEGDSLKQARAIIMLAFHLETVAARCFVEVEELDAARARLREGYDELQPRVASLVKKLVGDRPALYFHESVDEAWLERYISIERWLRGEQDVLPAILRDYRSDFWNEGAIERLFTLDPLRRSILVESPFYAESLPLAESLIEEAQRFHGMQLELESLDTSFADWERLCQEKVADHDDYALTSRQRIAAANGTAKRIDAHDANLRNR